MKSNQKYIIFVCIAVLVLGCVSFSVNYFLNSKNPKESNNQVDNNSNNQNHNHNQNQNTNDNTNNNNNSTSTSDSGEKPENVEKAGENKKTYIVTFDSQGGSSVEKQTVAEGSTVSVPKDPTRNGYTFDGWYLDGVKYDFNKAVKKNITLKANWEKNNSKDNVPPSGSCEGYYSVNDNKSHITIKASDNVGIAKYVINDKEYVPNKNPYSVTINGYITITHVVNIKIYDTSNNQTDISCQLVHNGVGNLSILTDADEKNHTDKKYLIMSKDTIKVWMEHKNVTRKSKMADYYLTYIWMKDPYNQIKLQVANSIHKLDDYNNNRETYQEIPSSILKDAISEDSSLNNKSLIAINASSQSGAMVNPYYIKNGVIQTVLADGTPNNTYDDTTGVTYNYKGTRTITANTHYVYSITKDGYLKHYTKFLYKKDSPLNEKTYKSILSDNPKITFSFYPVLISDGKSFSDNDSSSTTLKMRQVLCQIDKNNFVILTSNYKVGSQRPTPNQEKTEDYKTYTYTGLQVQSVVDELLGLGCKTAVNLDGGGSVALIVKKDKNTKILSGDNRVTPDLLYFQE